MSQTLPPVSRSAVRLPDPRLIRLWNPETKQFLHMSGEIETPNETYAWLGHKIEARILRERALKAGKAWPYKARLRGRPDRMAT